MPTTIAILSPGDMGHAVGRVLAEAGHEIVTCLDGRSARTKALARSADIADLGDLGEVGDRADLILSILVPAEAEALAFSVASAIGRSGAATAFADCNAVSPATSLRIERAVTGAGGRYIDASIIGPPPGPQSGKGDAPRFYTSGPHAALMQPLDGAGIVVRNLGPNTGAASAIKMCYAGYTKGTSALSVGVLALAQRLGVAEELDREFSESQAAGLARMKKQIPGLPVKARRWVGEMEEIAATFGAAGLPSGFHEASAAIYGLMGETEFAEETPETLDRTRSLWQTIAGLKGREAE
jgi:3-hydroxyisobutyrate dehydrogenase-like beta-hydroxyacid dehydrogenase